MQRQNMHWIATLNKTHMIRLPTFVNISFAIAHIKIQCRIYNCEIKCCVCIKVVLNTISKNSCKCTALPHISTKEIQRPSLCKQCWICKCLSTTCIRKQRLPYALPTKIARLLKSPQIFILRWASNLREFTLPNAPDTSEHYIAIFSFCLTEPTISTPIQLWRCEPRVPVCTRINYARTPRNKQLLHKKYKPINVLRLCWFAKSMYAL